MEKIKFGILFPQFLLETQGEAPGLGWLIVRRVIERSIKSIMKGLTENSMKTNLEELIEACGFDFRSLSNHTPKTSVGTPRWIAQGGKRLFGKWRLFVAKTPTEAVEKLRIALNNKLTL